MSSPGCSPSGSWACSPPPSCSTCGWSGSPPGDLAAGEAGGEVRLDRVQPDALLAHRVPFPDGDGLVVEGVEVDGEAERRPHLVLAAVPPADGAGVVEVDVPVLPQDGGQVLRL